MDNSTWSCVGIFHSQNKTTTFGIARRCSNILFFSIFCTSFLDNLICIAERFLPAFFNPRLVSSVALSFHIALERIFLKNMHTSSVHDFELLGNSWQIRRRWPDTRQPK
jgi:hypothetical protein